MEGKGGQEPGIRQGSQTVTYQVENRGQSLGTNKSFSHSLYKHSLNLSRVSGTLLGTVGGGGAIQMCKTRFLPWGEDPRKQIIPSP